MRIQPNMLFHKVMFRCATSRPLYLNLNGKTLQLNIFSIKIKLISPRGVLSENKMTYLLQLGSEGNSFVCCGGCVYYHYVFL